MLFLLLFTLTAHTPSMADDQLQCQLARGSVSDSLSSAFTEGSAEAQTPAPNAQGLALDSSVSPSTWFLVLDDARRQVHVAFSGSARAVSTDGAKLSLGDASVSCRKNVSGKLSLAPPAAPELPDYFVCMLDEAHFVKGEIAATKRRLFRAHSPLEAHLPVTVAENDDAAAFRVNLVTFDPFRGLDITLTDKASGETARYTGPARSMGSSFLLGLTVGDRSADARFLRLGCVWTDDPAKFKQ